MERIKRTLCLLLCLVMVIGLLPVGVLAASTDETAANVEKVLAYADQMREANRKDDLSKGGLSWDTEGKNTSWRYFNGAMIDAFTMVGTEEMMSYAAEFYADNTDSNGNPKNYRSGEVDSVPMALGMFELLDDETYGDRFANAIQYVYDQLSMQTILGVEYGYNYWHKTNSDSWKTWKFGLDGLYMADVFEVQYANAVAEGKLSSDKNPADIYKSVYTRFEWVAETMLDKETGLYHHGWNGSNGNGHFWGRGIGWYAIALVDAIELMPEGTYKEGLIDNLPALFNGMLAYQDASTGMWYNIVNQNDSLSKNKLETSVSAMMAYALMKAYNNGWVGESYGEAGLKAFNGIVNNEMTSSAKHQRAGGYSVKDIYQKSGVGTSDSDYTVYDYVSDEAKGTAALIMAATVANEAAEKLAGTVTPEPSEPETTEPVKEEVDVTVGEQTVHVVFENVADLTVAEASTEDKALIEEKNYANTLFFDATATLAEGEKAVISIPVPADWNITSADQLVGLSVEDGVVKEIPGTLTDGIFSFEVDHFSAKGIAQVEGSLSAGKNYELDTDGVINVGEKYIIVAEYEGVMYALTQGATKTENNKYEISTAASVVTPINGNLSLEDDTSFAVTISTPNEMGNVTIVPAYDNDADATNNPTLEVGGDPKFKYEKNKVKLIHIEASETVNGAYSLQKVKDNGTAEAKYLIYGNKDNKVKWTESQNLAYVYLYKYAGDATAEKIVFTLDQDSVTMLPNSTATLTGTVVVGEGETADTYDLKDCTIEWSSIDHSVVTVSGGVVTSYEEEGDTFITAKLVAVNGKTVADGGITLTVNVTVQDRELDTENYTPEYTGPSTLKTQVGVPFDFSGMELKVKYTDDDEIYTITTNNGLKVEDFSINEPHFGSVKVTYRDVEYGKVFLIVEGDPYEGKEEADHYPEYPEDGAVRVQKDADDAIYDFQRTGLTRVELAVAGTSIQTGVDVVLVVDVSNSMAWTDHWFENLTEQQIADAKDADKVAKNDKDQLDPSAEDKLDQAMDAATEFAYILLADNKEGADSNNTISFVTFAGDNGAGDGVIDAVQTVFTGVEDATLAEKAFQNTDFYNLEKNGDKGSLYYYLQIGKTDGTTLVSGKNRGNTNYDYAFGEAKAAITALQSTYDDYAATGRETIVVFMTDGAPSHYNDDRTNGTAADKLYGTNTKYPDYKDYGEEAWLEKINNYNIYAAQVADLVSIENMYAVGFDLDHGGFTGYSWTQEELEPVLAGIASDEKNIPTMLATSGQELIDFYGSLASSIKMAGESAQAEDIISSDFTLQMASTIDGVDMNTNEPFVLDLDVEEITPSISVIVYDLWTKEETDDPKLIGTRKGTSTVIETVTFNDDGTAAYSTVGDVTSNNIMSIDTANNITTISAQNFTYTKLPDGTESFDWRIGYITNKEITLAFDAYLKDSLKGGAAPGVYYTNEEATLEYIDIYGKHATQIFPVPAVGWEEAVTTYEFYLTNSEGQPINHAGEVIPFANRVIVGGPISDSINKYLDTQTQYATILSTKVIPEDYTLLDPTAYYSFKVDPAGIALTINGLGTVDVMNGKSTAYSTHVAFAVTSYPGYLLSTMVKDAVVIDYGKTLPVDVLANDTETQADYTKTVVGFEAATAGKDLSKFFTDFDETTNATYSSENGSYAISDDGKVLFTPTKMLSSVEKVLVVVKFVDDADYFYMYNELRIIPATIMYYETDFTTGGVFEVATTNAEKPWETMVGSPEADGPQDDGTIGVNQTYGYDSTYENDAYLSNGSSLFVEGAGVKVTTAQFSVTGTGFDIISRTGAAQGAIRVSIYTDADRTTLYKAVTVLNKSESNLELYQIPVVSVNDLPYGTYYVTVGVNAAYTNETYPQLDRGGEFYFDALRVYDPVKGNAVAEAAYNADGEAENQLDEVRALLLDAATYASIEGSTTGMVYLDSTYTDGNPDNEDGDVNLNEVVGVADYAKVGPNNEVYLSKDQAVAFKVDATTAPASFDIGAKSITGGTAGLKVIICDEAGKAYWTVTKAIGSSTVQFIDLLAAEGADASKLLGAYVLITNTADGVLSITDLKAAFSNSTAAAIDDPYGIDTASMDLDDPYAVSYSVDTNTFKMARSVMMYAAPEEPETPEELEVPEEPEVDTSMYNIQKATAKLAGKGAKQKFEITVITSQEVTDILVTGGSEEIEPVKIDYKDKKKEGTREWKIELSVDAYNQYGSFSVAGMGDNGLRGEAVTVTATAAAAPAPKAH